MTRDVLIKISGFQNLDGDQENVEMITTGDYFLKNGKHYIVYDEMMEGVEGNIRNTLKIMPGKMDIQRRGSAQAHMIFEENKKNMTRYLTPMGEMVVGIFTNQICLEESPDSLRVSVDYSLDINYDHISDCCITLDICSRQGAALEL